MSALRLREAANADRSEDDPEGALATICFDQEKVMTYWARDRKIVRSVCEEFPIGPWFVSIAIETSRNSRQG